MKRRRWLMLAACGALLGMGGWPVRADTFDRTRHVHAAPGVDTQIGKHAHWNKRCQPTAAPVIFVTQPPSHGAVSTRPGSYIATGSIGGAICNGREVSGTLVFYTPAAGFTGGDQVTYTVSYGAEIVTVTVIIAVP